MYYIINNNTDKLALFDDNKERFDKTLQFMPELQNERILETDIITATELQQHPNKCIVGDINIEIIAPDYETQTREVENVKLEWTTETRTGTRIKVDSETGEPIINPETGEYETEEYTYEVKVPVMETVQEVDEEGNPVWTTDPETEERIPVMVTRQKSHVETHTEEVQVQIGEHTEVITVRGLVLNPDYEAQKAAEERLKLDALTLTPSDVERALYYGLDMDFDERTEQLHEYYAPEGQTNGMIDSKSEYESMSQGGAAATPGTDSNDDTTYVIEDSEITLSTISDVTTDYINNEKITTYVQSVGKINCATSSISIVLTDWVVYKEDVLRASGALDDMTFDEYIVANSEPVKREVDEDYYELVSNATGFPVESITILSYAQPMFEYSSKGNRTLSDYLQLILVIFIFSLLGLVVFRSMRRDQTQEPEAELSVENLLESTKESQEVLADIGYNEKSETRILIEKFVEQNPEAAASLLRNWLNEDWE